MRLATYVLRRASFVPLQFLGISLVTFFLIRLLPGDPATQIAGSYATPTSIAAIHHHLGLDQPIPVQYFLYVRNLFIGDWGRSWYTSNAVTTDISQRLPATLELVSIALFTAMILGIALGVFANVGPRGSMRRGFTLYGLLSGSFPDFWIGLALILIFFVWLGLAPAPLGQLDPAVSAPQRVTGMIVVDALLRGDWDVFRSAVSHLSLPVATLTVVFMAPILRMTTVMMEETLGAPFILYARACGLSRSLVARYALRAALPPVITLVGIVFGYLLGGAVVVEVVFSWGGIGQYAVQSIANSDFAPIQGFVLLAATLSLLIYLAVDLINFAVDPRLTA